MNLRNAQSLFLKGVQTFARIEQQGIRVDMDIAIENYNTLTKSIAQLTVKFKGSKLFKYWDHSTGTSQVNIDSNEQLAHFLYKTKKITPTKFTATGKGAVDEEALKGLGLPELDDLLQLRKLKKLRDTYLTAFISESVDGFIHPVFNLHTVSTYRSSSDSPNFQNIPIRDEEAKKIIRSCLFPRKGHQLLEVDFSGIEVGIAACYHKDSTMIKYIKDQYDMHADMAKQIFFLDTLDKKQPAHKLLRNAAKNGFVFPQFYGDYYKNNAISLGDWTKLPLTGKYKDSQGITLPQGHSIGAHLINCGIPRAEDFVEHLRKIEEHFWGVRFPVYANWKKRWFKKYQTRGFFETLTGFRCFGIMSKNDVINYPVQGSAFHCLLWSLIRIDEIIQQQKLQTRLIGQIHDSMVFDVYPPELDYVVQTVRRVTEVELLQAWDWIIVPLRIEAEVCQVDESWYHKKELNLD